MGKKKPQRFNLLSERIPEQYDLVIWKDPEGRCCPGWMQNGRPTGDKLEYLKGELSWRRYCHIEKD